VQTGGLFYKEGDHPCPPARGTRQGIRLASIDSGFSMRHTDYTQSHLESRLNNDGVVILENARNCTIISNYFQHLGGYAIWLRLDARDNQIETNTAKELGAGFVLATCAQLS
jgi:hypothetical protein